MKALTSYAVPAPENIDSMSCHETTLRYVRELEGGGLFCCGLHPDPGAVLIDRQCGLDRHALNTLHDYCLFAKSKGEFYKKQSNELAAELRAMGIEPPAEFVLCVEFPYPGSRSFAFELNGKLIIT